MKLHLGIVTIGLILIFASDLFKVQDYCSFNCSRSWDDILLWWFIFFAINFAFLLIFSFLPPRFYRNWWKFARIAIPITLFISTLINLKLHHKSGGFLNMDNIFDLPILFTTYVIFVTGSVIQIIRGYLQK